MMIKLKNVSGTETANFTTLSVKGQSIAPGEQKTVYNNNNMSGMGANSIETLQLCAELMGFITNDVLVFIINGVEADKAQSLNIMQPVLNFP